MERETGHDGDNDSSTKLRLLVGAKTGKGRVRGHMMWLPHHPPDLHRLFNKVVVEPGIVGPDAKAIGPRPAQHLSGPRGAQHDPCADPRDARQNKKCTRHRAPHDSSSVNQSISQSVNQSNEPLGR